MPLDYAAPHTPVYARDPASKSFLLDGAIEGHVLVKNLNNSLPLKSPKLLSIFGYDAVAPPVLDIGSALDPSIAFSQGYWSISGVESCGNPQLPGVATCGTLIVGGKSPYIDMDRNIPEITDILNIQVAAVPTLQHIFPHHLMPSKNKRIKTAPVSSGISPTAIPWST